MDRHTAMLKSLLTYKSDKPCKRGHNSERYTSTGNCVECHKRYANKFRSRHSLFKLIEIRAHPDDIEAITAYADALRIQREIKMMDDIRATLAESHLPPTGGV